MLDSLSPIKKLAKQKSLSYNVKSLNLYIYDDFLVKYMTISQNNPFELGTSSQKDRQGASKMDFLSSNVGLMLQRSMNFLWTKQDCILDNISNAETPGYKAKYATFEESLAQAIQAADKGTGSSVRQLRDAIETAPISVQQAQESTRLDDNGVNVTDQMVELARNGYQIQYVMDAINSDFSLLRTAIKG